VLCGLLFAHVSGAAAPVQFDHVWIVTAPHAPERKLLEDAGFTVAAQLNTHEGQGTASVTIEFLNGYLELMWLDESVPGTPVVVEKFRNRSQWRTSGWAPIGIALHRTGKSDEALPWPSWKIPRADWLREGTAIEMLTPRENPKAVSVFVEPSYLAVDEARNRATAAGASPEAKDFKHANGTHRITAVRVIAPDAKGIEGLPRDDLHRLGICDFKVGEQWQVELTLDGGLAKKERDLRPGLPLVIHY